MDLSMIDDMYPRDAVEISMRFGVPANRRADRYCPAEAPAGWDVVVVRDRAIYDPLGQFIAFEAASQSISVWANQSRPTRQSVSRCLVR